MYKEVHFLPCLRLIFSRSSHPACLFSKGFVFPLPAIPAVSGKTSGTVFLFNKHLSLADCCILFTITIKKTKCSTALSAPIFLSLLFCSGGVFPLNRFKNRRCIICAAKRISASIAVRGILPSLFLFIPHIRPQLVL